MIGARRSCSDQEMRTEIYDAIQGVLDDYDLLVTPTLACLPVDNAHRRQHHGPDARSRARRSTR